MAARDWTTVQLVCAEPAGHFDARNPFPPGGVYEDPATGAAAAAFGAYLAEIGAIDPPTRITIRKVWTWAGRARSWSTSPPGSPTASA